MHTAETENLTDGDVPATKKEARANAIVTSCCEKLMTIGLAQALFFVVETFT